MNNSDKEKGQAYVTSLPLLWVQDYGPPFDGPLS